MFYGWVMVAVAFVTQFISSGVIFYTFGIALKEWTVEFDAGRFGVSGIHFVLPWAGAAMAPFVGRLASAGHLRLLIPAGAVAAGLGFCAISQATSLWQLYVVYPLLMAYAAGTLSGVGASTLVVNWFSRTRATALGISQIGASVRRHGHGAAHGLALRRPRLAKRLSRIRARDPRHRTPARLADRRPTRRSRPASRRRRCAGGVLPGAPSHRARPHRARPLPPAAPAPPCARPTSG